MIAKSKYQLDGECEGKFFVEKEPLSYVYVYVTAAGAAGSNIILTHDLARLPKTLKNLTCIDAYDL